MPGAAAFQGRTQPSHLGANALDPHNLDLELDLDLDVFRMYLRAKIKFQVKTFKSYSQNSTDGHTHTDMRPSALPRRSSNNTSVISLKSHFYSTVFTVLFDYLKRNLLTT